MTASPTAAAALSPFDAVIFDLDGVVTDTAAVHETVWTELFNEVLKDPLVQGKTQCGRVRQHSWFPDRWWGPVAGVPFKAVPNCQPMPKATHLASTALSSTTLRWVAHSKHIVATCRHGVCAGGLAGVVRRAKKSPAELGGSRRDCPTLPRPTDKNSLLRGARVVTSASHSVRMAFARCMVARDTRPGSSAVGGGASLKAGRTRTHSLPGLRERSGNFCRM